MNARDNGENRVVIGPSHVELGPQVPAMVGNWSLTLSLDSKYSATGSSSVSEFAISTKPALQ